MTLYIIGLGLRKEDISLRALNIIRSSDIVFLEQYTSIIGSSNSELESFFGKKLLLASRNLVESEAEKIISPALDHDVAFLVVGDPFGATTHTDLFLRARKSGVKIVVLHNVSIINAVGEVGLELYKYGRTTSIPFWSDGFEPETPYDAIKTNLSCGLHTLCLLDIKVDQGRFMTINEAIKLLIKIEGRRKENIMIPDRLAVGVARLGHDNKVIISGPIKDLLDLDFGPPLHSLIIPGPLHIIEEEALNLWKNTKTFHQI